MAGVSGDAVVVQPCGFRYQEQIEIIRQFREAETGLQPVIIHCWRAGGRLQPANICSPALHTCCSLPPNL